MNQPVLAVEANGRQPPSPSVADAGPERPNPKFVYALGDRPLEGYTIKRGVGHGGFGEIYYAVSDAGKEVALKLVRRNLEVELRGIRQCLNLKHPNLIDLHDIRQDDQGDSWVVMEFMSGPCLQEEIQDHPAGLPADEALAWFHGIAAGVNYLHDRGIVHRDLKPGNIFRDEGVVKVGDYGLSKFISCSRRSGHTESIGTVHYMAPEVANGRYGKELDVYALGVILYELLTGRVPFEGESIGEVLMKHLTAEPDLSMIAEPYRSVIHRALEKDPAKRFASAREMAAQLPAASQSAVGAVSAAAFPTAAHASPDVCMASLVELPAAPRPATTDEPVARAIGSGLRRLRDAWNSPHLNTPVRLVLLVAGIFLLLSSAGVWFPLVIPVLILYCAYLLVRAIVLVGQGSGARRARPRDSALEETVALGPAARAAMTPRPVHLAEVRVEPARMTPARRRLAAARWRDEAAAALAAKPARQRVAELLGSMVVGALVALTMCLIMVVVTSFRGRMLTPEQTGWLALVSILGSWAVLAPAKLWEGRQGEPLLRRLVLLVLGLGVGTAAAGLASYLNVSLPPDAKLPQPPDFGRELPNGFFAADGSPQLMAYLAVFGMAFLVLRWWRQADPLRSARLSLWSLVATGIVAAIVAGVWQFRQPWLIMVAAIMSVSVQLASPWIQPPRPARV